MWSTTNNPMGAATATALLVLAGCWSGGGGQAGGQSGGLVDGPGGDHISEVQIVECQCLLANLAVATRGVLASADECVSSIEVEEVLAGADRFDAQPGELLEGRPIFCVDREGIQAGDEVLALFVPEIMTGPDDQGRTHTTPARVFYVPLDAPIRIDGTDEDLPADRDDALRILLDLDACTDWTDAHRPAPQEGEGEEDLGEPIEPIEPEEPVTNAPPPDDEEPGAPPTCGI
jgi:hypothetical protein